MIKNQRTPEGEEFGRHMARLCETAIRGEDKRCSTCAFRQGNLIANGSPQTLMTALKCVMERTPFYCHEIDVPCAGWLAMRFEKGKEVYAPWSAIEGNNAMPNPIQGFKGGIAPAVKR